MKNLRTSSSDVLAEPTTFSSSPTRRSISAVSLAVSNDLWGWSPFLLRPPPFVSGTVSAGRSTGCGSCSTPWTSRTRPSWPTENFASRVLTSTRPLRRSPGSTWPCSRSRASSGLAGSASSVSREASSDCSNFKRSARDGGCVGVGDGVREGGYAYKDRSRVPAARSELKVEARGERELQTVSLCATESSTSFSRVDKAAFVDSFRRVRLYGLSRSCRRTFFIA